MYFEKVKALIAKELSIDENKITMESKLLEDLGADSLDSVELIMAIEDEFDVQVSDEVAQNIRKVADIVEYLEKRNKIKIKSSVSSFFCLPPTNTIN